MSGIFVVYLIVIVLSVAGLWQAFVKAGQPGWGAIIPIYNAYLICKVVGRPGWWTILFIIPFVNVVIAIIVGIDMAKSFGKSGAFAAGLILLGFIFYPILGYGPARYLGPANRI